MLFSTDHSIRGVPIDPVESFNTEAFTPILGRPQSSLVAVEFDAEEDFIYYSDVRKDIIFRVHPNGTGLFFLNLGNSFIYGSVFLMIVYSLENMTSG